MYIVLVEHQNAGKRYVFDCTALSDVVRLGETVICENIRGKQIGKAVTNPIRVESNEGSLASLFKLCGVYLPIKRIVGIECQRELTEAEKERIAMEWLKERLDMELDTFLKLLGGDEDAGQDHRREAGVAEEGR